MIEFLPVTELIVRGDCCKGDTTPHMFSPSTIKATHERMSPLRHLGGVPSSVSLPEAVVVNEFSQLGNVLEGEWFP